ncbi:hypothetical protein [Falsiroseomonas sp.]|uniref:hypothetical protein n=1 Tax=Falsiroseomonas sp. TaxID=2870721 RepID=UPI003F71D664
MSDAFFSQAFSSSSGGWAIDRSPAENLSEDFGAMETTLDAMTGFQSPAAKGLGTLSTVFSGFGIADHLAEGEWAEATIDGFTLAGSTLAGGAGAVVGGLLGAPAGPPGAAVGAGAVGLVGAQSGGVVGEELGEAVVQFGTWAGNATGLIDTPFTTVNLEKEGRLEGAQDLRTDFPGVLDAGPADDFDTGRFGATEASWASGSFDGDYGGSGWDGGSGFDTGFNSDGWGGGSSDGGSGWDGGSGFDTGFNSDGWGGEASGSFGGGYDTADAGGGWASGSPDGDYSGTGWDGGSGFDTGFNSDGWGGDSIW